MKDLIVVTGAAGFIGRNVVAELNRRGQEQIWIVDELGKEEKWRNLRGLIFEEILSPDHFLQLLRDDRAPKIKAIIHLGACSATTEKDADYLLRNNYSYSREVCEWCLHHWVRFIYASSAATYGMGELGFIDDDNVTPSLMPLNMYGYSKHLFDLWALRAGHFTQIAGLKYFNVYGPYEDHKADMRSVVHKAYGQIQMEGLIRLFRSYRAEYKDGEQKRDFVYIRDAVDVTLHFLEHPKKNGLFNCGTGYARTWIDLAHSLFTAMGKEPRIEFIDMPEMLRPKYQYYTQANLNKLRSIGYTQDFVTLEEGVRDYVQSFLSKEAA